MFYCQQFIIIYYIIKILQLLYNFSFVLLLSFFFITIIFYSFNQLKFFVALKINK